MLRYITAATIAALLLAVALKSRPSDAHEASPREDATIIHGKPELSVTPSPDGGVDLRLRHRFVGSVSRASLVYELNGTECTLDKTTNCQRSFDSSAKVKGDGFQSEVELAGHLPKGFRALRLVLEDETGTRILPVSLD